MTFDQFVEQLAVATQHDSFAIRLAPGPIDLKVGCADAQAAAILRQLMDRSKAGLSFGEAEGILMYNVLQEMNRVTGLLASASPGDGQALADPDSADDPECSMADVLNSGDVDPYLTAWWWLVFFAALDLEPKDSPPEQLTPREVTQGAI